MIKYHLFLFIVIFLISCADPAKWRTASHIEVIESAEELDSINKELDVLMDSTYSETTVVQNGWLFYEHGKTLAFFPIQNQSNLPTYENFLTETKDYGQRLNDTISALDKIILAKQLYIDVYENEEHLSKKQFFIQPVKYTYKIVGDKPDTTDYYIDRMGWTLILEGKRVAHRIFDFDHRGIFDFLNKQDSISASQGGRNKNIKVYLSN